MLIAGSNILSASHAIVNIDFRTGNEFSVAAAATRHLFFIASTLFTTSTVAVTQLLFSFDFFLSKGCLRPTNGLYFLLTSAEYYRALRGIDNG